MDHQEETLAHSKQNLKSANRGINIHSLSQRIFSCLIFPVFLVSLTGCSKAELAEGEIEFFHNNISACLPLDAEQSNQFLFGETIFLNTGALFKIVDVSFTISEGLRIVEMGLIKDDFLAIGMGIYSETDLGVGEVSMQESWQNRIRIDEHKPEPNQPIKFAALLEVDDVALISYEIKDLKFEIQREDGKVFQVSPKNSSRTISYSGC